MGVLYDLSKPNMLDTLTRSGLSHLTQKELAKIMEAAVLISPVCLPSTPSFPIPHHLSFPFNTDHQSLHSIPSKPIKKAQIPHTAATAPEEPMTDLKALSA